MALDDSDQTAECPTPAALSVVVPSYNQVHYLGRTLESILSQQGPYRLETLVIDGGSTDGSVDLLGSITDPRLRWISEPDRGQAHAINKGLAMASGDIVGWVNSDDLYLPGSLAAVAAAFTSHPAAKWLAGRCIIIDEHDQEVRRHITRYKDRQLRRYRYGRLLSENFISSMAVFWRRSFGQEAGPLREDLQYVMDYELWLRMGRMADPLILDDVLAAFRTYPTSKTGSNSTRQFREQWTMAQPYFQGHPIAKARHAFNMARNYAAYAVMQRFR